MTHPGEIIGKFGPALMAGRFEALANGFAYPLVITMNERHHIVGQPEDMVWHFRAFYDQLLLRGVEIAETIVESQILSDDLAFMIARTLYSDGDGQQLTSSLASYVMRLNDSGRWEVLMLGIDRKADLPDSAYPLEAARS